jgi:SPP1 gp7 family putative phage head morphogenesis protein
MTPPVTPAELAALLNQPPEAAVEFFRAKGLALTWNWHDQWRGAHSRAFTVAKLTRLDILQDIQDAVQRALDTGEAEAEFKKRMGALLQQKGWWGKKIVVGADGQAEVVQEGSPRRLSTIFRTNLQSAYMAGRWKQFAGEAAEAPYVQYIAIMDGRTRPAHAAFHGKVFRIDSPVWQVIAPPNGINCRCRIRNLSAAEMLTQRLKAETDARIETRVDVKIAPVTDRRTGELDPDKLTRRGVSIPDPADPTKRLTLFPDAGFDYNPGAGPALGDLPARKLDAARPPLAAQVVRDLVNGPAFARWYEHPEGDYPLVVLPDADAALIGARTHTGLLSAATAEKQAQIHPELTAAEYAKAQDAIDNVTHRVQDSPQSMVYARVEPTEEAGGHVVVVKATTTGKAVWVTSFRRLSRKEAERDIEIGRLLRKETK